MSHDYRGQKTALQFHGSNRVMERIALRVRWSGRLYELDVDGQDTLLDVKRALSELTNVLPARQKLLIKDVTTGKPAMDGTIALAFARKKPDEPIACVMVGTPEKDIIVYDVEREESDVLNDLDLDYSRSVIDAVHNNPEYHQLIEQVTRKTELNIINPLRPGKRLLVLDLDYTLFDMKSSASNFLDLKRPFTDDFLKVAYQHYDICVWSQTHWRYLEMKLTELGILTHNEYRISFVLDRTSMFSVSGIVKGKSRKHQVKPLKVIWNKFPQFNAKNTLHIDDLSRNFAMNPANGLKISAFRDAHRMKLTDNELLHLSEYVQHLSSHDDFTKLDHNKWKEILRKSK